MDIDPAFHDRLENYPPLVENKAIFNFLYSPHQKELAKEYKVNNEGERLIADLTNKDEYVLSGYALKTYLRCGVRLKSIKAGICYKQSPFLKNQMRSQVFQIIVILIKTKCGSQA